MTDRLLAELISLHEQLRSATTSPGIEAARRLTTDVMPVLEPVWSVVVSEHNGVGFLRRLGTDDLAVSADTRRKIVRAYGSIDLTAPDLRDVWRVLSRPSAALVDSVRQPLRAHRVAGDGVQATLGASVRPALPTPLLGRWTDEGAVVPQLRRVLRMWCELARNSTGERREVARLTLAAAMLARGAVLDGDTETVKWFVKRWLGLNVTDSRVDGTSAALLENGWHRSSVDEEFSAVRDSVTDLRIEAKYQHRLHRPVWETQLRGGPVSLLTDEQAAMYESGDEDTVEIVSKALLKDQVKSVMSTISEREATLVRMSFMDGLSISAISAELHISRHRVRKMQAKALSKLRHGNRYAVLDGYL